MTSAAQKHSIHFLKGLGENTAISPRLFADQFHIDFETLADLSHVELAVLLHKPDSESLQKYMRDAANVVSLLLDLNGGDIGRAMAWFHHAPLIELGGATAEHYISQGRADAVHRYALALAAGATG